MNPRRLMRWRSIYAHLDKAVSKSSENFYSALDVSDVPYHSSGHMLCLPCHASSKLGLRQPCSCGTVTSRDWQTVQPKTGDANLHTDTTRPWCRI